MLRDHLLEVGVREGNCCEPRSIITLETVLTVNKFLLSYMQNSFPHYRNWIQ